MHISNGIDRTGADNEYDLDRTVRDLIVHLYLNPGVKISLGPENISHSRQIGLSPAHEQALGQRRVVLALDSG